MLAAYFLQPSEETSRQETARVEMPFNWYTRITPDDLDALVAYLRSLESVK